MRNKTQAVGIVLVKGSVMGLHGRHRCVEELVDAYYVPLYRYAYRLTGSGADAEDLTQEAFCKAQPKLCQLRDPACAKPWLFRILRNAYLHKVRAAKSHHCASLEDMSEVPERPPDSGALVEPEKLQEALNELPEVFRTPIILYYFDDFSYRDIAEQMEVPLGTVMSRLARAKAYLRRRLLSLTLSSPVGSGGKRDRAVPETAAEGRATDGL
jgi:RNA polymerase sigma-70 factor (ECF subfamily)